MLADTAVLARDCAARKVGLAAFNVVLLDHAEAFVDAAENTGLPLVLQLSQNAVKYHGGRLRPLGRALIELAEASTVPVSVHLDHAESTDLCREAVELGFTSIMYDGSKLPDAQNRETTAEITRPNWVKLAERTVSTTPQHAPILRMRPSLLQIPVLICLLLLWVLLTRWQLARRFWTIS